MRELTEATGAFERQYASQLPRLQARGNAYHVWMDATATCFTLVVTVHGVTTARRLLASSGRVLGYAGRPVPPSLLIIELLLGQYLTPAVGRWVAWVAGVAVFITSFLYFYFTDALPR